MNNNKNNKNTYIFIVVVGFVFFLMLALHTGSVAYDTPNSNALEQFGRGLDHFTTNPIDIKITNKTGSTVMLYLMLYGGIVFALFIDEERHRHNDSKTIKGSADWMGDLNIYNKKYSDPENSVSHNGYKNMILANDIYLSMDGRQTMKNNNILVVGGAGTGKSRFVIKPNILQMNASFVVTDPSGELLESCGKVLEDNGYTIKVFNLTDMTKSNHYNPLRYIRDDLGVFTLVNCLITNTTSPDEGKGDAFWTKSETALLEAIIFYLVSEEPPELQNFATVMEFLRKGMIKEGSSSGSNDLDLLFDELRAKNPQHIALKQYDAFKSGSAKTLQSIIISCQMRLASFNIKEIADLTNNDDINLTEIADTKQAVFIILPTAHNTFNYLASLMYSQMFESLYYHAEKECPNSYIVRTSKGEPIKYFAGTTKEQIESTKRVMNGRAFVTEEEKERIENLDLPEIAKSKAEQFIKEKLNKLTVEKVEEINQKKKGKKKAYYYCRFKLMDNDGNLLTYFNCDKKDKKKQNAIINEKKAEYTNATVDRVGLKLPIDIRFLLDEFANIGQIPEFVQKLSTMRKYLMSCTIILQSLSQIKTMYKDNWENLMSNCHFLFLGGSEPTTLEHLNKTLGKATVVQRNRSSSKGKGGGSLSYNLDARDLMTVDELARMDSNECILMITNERPYKGRKFIYENHLNYKYTGDADPNNCYYIDLDHLIPKKNNLTDDKKESSDTNATKNLDSKNENIDKSEINNNIEENHSDSTAKNTKETINNTVKTESEKRSEKLNNTNKLDKETPTDTSVFDMNDLFGEPTLKANESAEGLNKQALDKSNDVINNHYDKEKYTKIKEEQNKLLFGSAKKLNSEEIVEQFLLESQTFDENNVDIEEYDEEITSDLWEYSLSIEKKSNT